MGLMARIRDNEECRVAHCHEPRVPGADFCRENGHLNDFWMHRLTKRPDGTYVAGLAPRFTARDMTGSAA